ncbi:saccharopine dehydrogenase NADP-binding domain-containing protein [Leptothoe sp. ISB3NOV94-8A]
MKNNLTILILGGYGRTGKLFCRHLLQETHVNIIVAGRRLKKATEFVNQLKKEFSPQRIAARYVDASDVASLHSALHDIDLLLVAATTTPWAKQIAEAAIATHTDYLDIYFQQTVYPILETLQHQITTAGCCFITQAGFHPGLPATVIRHGADYFDQYDKAIVAFVMNTRLDNSESLYELVDMVADYRPEIYQNGQWKIGTYQDAINIDYGPEFGVRSSMPIDMVEIKSLPESLGLQETGIYTTGFNWFTDYLIFPLIMLSQQIKKGFLRGFWAKMLAFGINTFSNPTKGVVFLLKAEGKKDGHLQQIDIISEHDSAYEFTVIPVIACLHQYLDGSIRKTGLWMMGHLVDPGRLLNDMEKMNTRLQICISHGDTDLSN